MESTREQIIFALERLRAGERASVIKLALQSNFMITAMAAEELMDTATAELSLAAKKMARKARKMQSLLDVYSTLVQDNTEFGIEEVSNLSPEYFFKNYYSVNRPLVIRGFAKSWKATSRWTPESLAQAIGSQTIEVMSARSETNDYEINREKCRSLTTMSALASRLRKEPMSNDYYMVAHNRTFRGEVFERLVGDLVLDPAIFDLDEQRSRINLWIGPGGTITPLHHDFKNVLLVQIHGSKEIYICGPAHGDRLYNQVGSYSPVDPTSVDTRKYPQAAYVRWQVCTLAAGDALFIPVAWWHYVKAIDVSISLSISNFRKNNRFEIQSP